MDENTQENQGDQGTVAEDTQAEAVAETVEVQPEEVAQEVSIPLLTDKLYSVTLVTQESGAARVLNLIAPTAIVAAQKGLNICQAGEYVYEIRFAGEIHG